MKYLILTDREADFLHEALSYQVHYVTEMTDEEKAKASAIVRKLIEPS